jgi:hypothetical protein
MRINVYHHELPVMAERHGLVSEAPEGHDRRYYGVRFYTEPERIDRPGDDDSSAITLWVPHTKDGHDVAPLREIGRAILDAAEYIEGQPLSTKGTPS